MAAGIYNFTIEQGATFTKNFTWLDSNNAAVNLTGWSARIQCRASIGSTATIFSYTTPSANLSIPTPANGTIEMMISATDTSNFPVGGVYDLEMVNGSTVVRLLQGTISLSGEITR
jgi:hypothetical protein